MSKKIYLSPSNQDGNLYAFGGTNEMEQCNRIADATKKILERCGFTVKKAAKGQAMRTSINESNAWCADLHICIHTNAGGGKGTEVFVYDKSADNMKYAQPIYSYLADLTKSTRGIKTADYTEITDTKARCVYVEVDFHDNKEIAKWIINNVSAIGEAIAKGVCKAYGVAYKAPTDNAQSGTAKTIYRIQVGAFAEKKNAENYLAKVKKAGFTNAYIVEVKQ